MSASNIVELCEQESITIPGLRFEANEAASRQHIGRIMGALFKTGNELVIEEFRLVRTQTYAQTDAGNSQQQKSYMVRRLDAALAPVVTIVQVPRPLPLAA
jgi:hypothetical protein